MGSGIGSSAVVWGKELQKSNGLLVCFDTWAGDLAMWLSEAWREVMGWQVSRLCKSATCRCEPVTSPDALSSCLGDGLHDHSRCNIRLSLFNQGQVVAGHYMRATVDMRAQQTIVEAGDNFIYILGYEVCRWRMAIASWW